MLKDKKYALRVVETEKGWSAQVTRRMTARKTVVSKSKAGFATEAEATEWGNGALQQIVENLMVRNQRRAKQREERTEALAAKEAAAQEWRDAHPDADEDDDEIYIKQD
ncbi:DUF3622 domain-containing protein [Shewanella algidipiscicola]|uniref:DUF3622 domain-containing protein n=1 Tax=Shewanella algidipiscicola TaxID=614070 RepID=A0ABQ4PJB0_9GAMM|nr:DUF3622 domain-containing protein [Shewanella algidipiscicola]GIU47634.1 hypothetical protein TUM4630_22070 [Shewanella algidipiscicola]